ncbi:MAG: tyrosine--tRNA ligase [Pseudomonadota bacterium]|nr:tyrosine--tRNA ligase [Pseudomonadota bacterium]
MTEFKSNFLNLMSSRGYIHQCSDEAGLDAAASDGIVTAYIGYDCTAKSLHVGNLISIMMLRKLQQAGGKPIVLMGGGTTKVGDPSGKDESRQLLTEEDIAANKKSIQKVFEKFLTFGDGPTDAIMLDNDVWLSELNYISFLRDYGRHFSVNRMLSFDSVKLRLDREQPLSFLEFNYMILQAYDFLELYRRHGCTLQMGGSDQWGNIINGIELGRRTDQAQLYALTTELLTTSSGAKMGKTAQGAVWLDAQMLSAWEYWQFWRNTEDSDVGKFLRLFTECPLEEISRLEQLEGAELNEAKKILATQATALVHGEEAAADCLKTATETFESGGTSQNLPRIDVPTETLKTGIGILEAFVIAGLANSNSEARRLLQGGGAKLNDATVSDIKLQVSSEDAVYNGTIKLSSGKKKHVLLKPV